MCMHCISSSNYKCYEALVSIASDYRNKRKFNIMASTKYVTVHLGNFVTGGVITKIITMESQYAYSA